jgi:hypothetical protein
VCGVVNVLYTNITFCGHVLHRMIKTEWVVPIHAMKAYGVCRGISLIFTARLLDSLAQKFAKIGEGGGGGGYSQSRQITETSTGFSWNRSTILGVVQPVSKFLNTLRFSLSPCCPRTANVVLYVRSPSKYFRHQVLSTFTIQITASRMK